MFSFWYASYIWPSEWVRSQIHHSELVHSNDSFLRVFVQCFWNSCIAFLYLYIHIFDSVWPLVSSILTAHEEEMMPWWLEEHLPALSFKTVSLGRPDPKHCTFQQDKRLVSGLNRFEHDIFWLWAHGLVCVVPSQLDVFEAAERYQRDGVPLIILAGKEYGSGSSRDWAAKGPYLLVLEL